MTRYVLTFQSDRGDALRQTCTFRNDDHAIAHMLNIAAGHWLELRRDKKLIATVDGRRS